MVHIQHETLSLSPIFLPSCFIFQIWIELAAFFGISLILSVHTSFHFIPLLLLIFLLFLPILLIDVLLIPTLLSFVLWLFFDRPLFHELFMMRIIDLALPLLLLVLSLNSVDWLLTLGFRVTIRQLLVLLVYTVLVSISLIFLDHSILLEGRPDLTVFIERLLVYVFLHLLILQSIVAVNFIHFSIPLCISVVD